MQQESDYEAMSLQQLQAEKKKLKQMEITGSVFMGLVLAVLVYGTVTQGLGWVRTGIPVILLLVFYRTSQQRKKSLQQISKAIAARQMP